MKTGKVKFFNEAKGFGFIVQDDGGPDLFVHASEVAGGMLNEGDTVEYEVAKVRKVLCYTGISKGLIFLQSY